MTRLGLSQDGYLDRLARYHRLFLTEIGLPYGQIWITEDHSAVAVWTTPKTPPDVFRPLAEQFREIAGDRAGPAAEYEQAMARFRPRTPVWFLGVLGVDPIHQRPGLGRAVIAPGLAAADEDNSPPSWKPRTPPTSRSTNPSASR